MNRWTRSIRVRLTATITASLAIILALVAVITYLLVRDTLYRHVDAELALRVQSLSAQLERNPNATIVGQRYVQNLLDPDHPANVQIMSRDGALLYIAPPGKLPHLPTSIARLYGTTDSGQLRWFATASPLYFLSVGLPVGDIEESLRVLRLTLGIAFPIALLITVLVGYRIARNSLAPVDEITATAHRITSQSLRQRIPATGTDDEIGRLIATLNDMIGRLEGSFTAITQFTTNAAHEMRTPLTILRGEMELALRRKDISSSERAVLESNTEEVNRLIGIVEDLFTLARADSNALSLSYEVIALDALLERLMSKVRALADSKHIAAELVISEPCTVVGDSNRLTQVVINLADNAVKYSPEHSSIAITLKRIKNTAEIVVRDTGMGIDPEHHEKIFERFYRTDDARTRSEGGTGLGLAIARSIIAAHNGDIRVESTPGQGSAFVITLPIAEID